VEYATDDGSVGHRGRITELLAREHEKAGAAGLKVRYYACGPAAMLSACAQFSQRTGVRGELALETAMPCASGVCLGCIVPCTNGDHTVYKRTCWDGPIFDAREVVWP
jgi:dihydroorotate dehydrogenase electron transfer subunit